MAPSYVCIESGRALESYGDSELICSVSGKRYPVLGGIPVLTVDPDALIRGFGDSWSNMVALAEKARSELEHLQAADVREGWLDRATRQVRGREANIILLQDYLSPIATYLRNGSCRTSRRTAFLHSHGAGWSLERMLPYFAQDWTESPDFERVRNLVIADLKRHSPDRRAVAILGTGACGLARAASEVFDEVHGVDLSLPTLLFARGALRGDAITVHLEQTGWSPVALKPSRSSAAPIYLVASDVNDLPLREGSLSAVITQYLMDLMIDPVATAQEIRRVLKPNGIWINFSNPLTFAEERSRFGSPRVNEMEPLFAPLGFETLHCERERFTLLNLDHLSAEGHRHVQEVHHFVMRKNPEAVGKRKSCNSTGDLWWTQVPHKVPHRVVQTSRKRVFDVSGVDIRFEIGVGDYLASADESTIAFFEFLLGQIDGHKAIADLYDIVDAHAPLSRDEFKSILVTMERIFGVVSLEVAAP